MKRYVYPKKGEIACFNCKYYMHMIGIGQGLGCKHPSNTEDSKMFVRIPSPYHSCDLFDRKKQG